MISRTGKLLIKYEEEGVVRLAHQSVGEYLETPTANSALAGFRFRTQVADREAGEICVTYLYLSNFERQVASYFAPRVAPLPITT